MNQYMKHFDILVAGAGPAGKCAALTLTQSGFTVGLASAPVSQTDRRTTALMMPSISLLDELGVWDELRQYAAPLKTMRIIDATNNLVRARPVTFNAAEIEEEAFGWNMPNEKLNAALDAKIANEPRITRYEVDIASYDLSVDQASASLKDGKVIVARLVVAADGRSSFARTSAEISTRNWSYPQTAFVTTFQHRLPHENMSTEFHTSAGPCVQVPLPGNQSSLVWVVAPTKAATLSEMDDVTLSQAIEAQLSSILGKVTVDQNRQTYPLSGQYAQTFAQKRVALIGEAAHVFPPIGAQGLNLGLRDVTDLQKATVSNPLDPGSIDVLDLYNRSRRPDIFARTNAVDALNRSLLSSFIPTQMARAVGLAALDMTPPLRGLFMREGMRPGDGIGKFFNDLSAFFKHSRTKQT